MMSRVRTSSFGTTRLAIGAAALAAAAVGFAASPIPRVTPDSSSYLTGAETIAADGRFESCTGPITLFAPGYAAALAPLVAAGLDATDAARIVNALATFGMVLATFVLARAATVPARIASVTAVAVAVAYATLRNGALAWSEPLFCALLGWLLALVLDRGRGFELRASPRVAGVVILAWALLLTRHAGVFVLPALVLAAWLGSDTQTNRVARVLTFAAALVAAPAVWWARNARIDGDPFGRRSQAQGDIVDVLRQFPDGISSVALPNAAPIAVRLLVLAPLLAAVALACRRGPRATVAILTTAAAGYALGVTAAATRTVVDPIDTRLLSPVLVPLAVLVAIGVQAPRSVTERRVRLAVLAVVATMAVVAPGVVWRSHEAERSLSNIPEDVSCARWPADYGAQSQVAFAPVRG